MQNKAGILYFPKRITEVMKRIFDYPLTIVEAPMGYGKTTAVREYLSNADANILWQRVYDNSETSFWKELCLLLSKLDTDRSYNLEQLGFPDDIVLKQEALKLIEDIELPEKTVLVIDDYHLINRAGIDNFIEFLVMNEIANLHIVLTARFIELLNMEELILKGYITHITKEIFEFVPIEIIKYYKLCGISLKDVEADKLFSFSEGWISALYLLMLNFKQEGNFTATANIHKLIEKAVYNPFSQNIKDFLLTMSIFDSFTIEQAIHMWGNEDAEKVIGEIIRKNAFVNYDIRTKTYQMHNIFTNFLKDVKSSKYIEDERCKRAAQWFMKIGDYLKAMHYFYECGDFENLFLAIEKDKVNSFNNENKELITKYIEACPQNIKVKHPVVLLSYAIHLFAFNEIELFEKACSEFVYNINADESLREDFKKELLGEYELLLSFTAYNDINKMSEHHQKACKLLTHSTSIYDTKNNWTFGSPSVLYMFYRETGKLEQNVKDIVKALPYYYRLTNGHGSGAEYIMEAERYFNMGDIENAEILLYKVFHKVRPKMETGIILCAEFLHMRISFMKGDLITILGIINNMRTDMTSRHEYNFIHTVEICEGYIYSLLKQSDNIPERIKQGNLNSTRLMFPAYAMLNIAYGRVLLINGEYLKLIGNTEHFLGIASAFSNLLAQIYTYIYGAAANRQIFRTNEAMSELAKALDIAMPDKVYMPFVENCDYIKPLLEQHYKEGRYREDIERIFDLFETYHKSFEKMIKENFSGERKNILTDREKEIAQFAADGLTNNEISRKLSISTNTVKTMLKGVFVKLDINSRALLKQYFEK